MRLDGPPAGGGKRGSSGDEGAGEEDEWEGEAWPPQGVSRPGWVVEEREERGGERGRVGVRLVGADTAGRKRCLKKNDGTRARRGDAKRRERTGRTSNEREAPRRRCPREARDEEEEGWGQRRAGEGRHAGGIRARSAFQTAGCRDGIGICTATLGPRAFSPFQSKEKQPSTARKGTRRRKEARGALAGAQGAN